MTFDGLDWISTYVKSPPFLVPLESSALKKRLRGSNKQVDSCPDHIPDYSIQTVTTIPSMGLAYLPTFGVVLKVNVGKYTSPMDAMGLLNIHIFSHTSIYLYFFNHVRCIKIRTALTWMAKTSPNSSLLQS